MHTLITIPNLIGYSIIIISVCLYIGFKIINPFQIPFPIKIVLYILIIVTGYMLPEIFIIPFISISPGVFHSLLFQMFSWIELLFLGFLSILVIFLITYDICVILIKAAGWIFKIINPQSFIKLRKIFLFLSEKHYFKKSFLYCFLVISALLTGYGVYKATSQSEIKYISVPIKNLPEELKDFRIVQLTDLHAGLLTDQNKIRQIVTQVNKLAPDVVVITGDLVDGNVEFLKDVLIPIGKLKTKYGSFFVTGNHEHYDYFDKWSEELSGLGLTVLINSHCIINLKNQRILIAGVTDYIAGKYDKNYATDPRRTIINAPACQVKIMLAHSPNSIYEVSKLGFDLQLSGHSHGGVYFPVSLIVKLRNFLFKIDNQPFRKGLHKYHNTRIYVSSGIGYWGPPLRIGNPSEISVFFLKEEKL